MKVIIIGSKGFIGSHCVNFFKTLGAQVWEADIVVVEHPQYFQLNPYNTDFSLVFTNTYDICINASGSANVGFSFENPAIDFELNVANVHKILLCLRNHNPKCKFINFSSAAVYGNPISFPIDEYAPLKPLSPYGFHKLQSEYLLTEYHKFFGLHTCSLRVFSAYGPGLKKQLFWDLYQKACNLQMVELYGTGQESRDFIYIDDILQAIHCIIKKASFEGDIFNLATGTEIFIKEAVRDFYYLLDPEKKYFFSGKTKTGDPNNWVANIQKIQQLGFQPKFTLTEGLQKYIQWLIESELV